MEQERRALFIDGANLHATTKLLGFRIDFKRMYDYFSMNSYMVRAYYYTAMLEEHGKPCAIRPLVDYLQHNSYTVVKKPAKTFTLNGVTRTKGNMDIEMACDALELADKIDHAILFTGDGDFCYLVNKMKAKGCRITVVSTTVTATPMIASELKQTCDQYLDLVAIKSHIIKIRSIDEIKASVAQRQRQGT